MNEGKNKKLNGDNKSKTITINGKKPPEKPKGSPLSVVVCHCGSRTFIGMVSQHPDKFDRLAGEGKTLKIHGAVELCHLNVTEDEGMAALVSMTGIDHLVGMATALRVRPDSWYWLNEQNKLSQHVYQGIYNATARDLSARAQRLGDELKARMKGSQTNDEKDSSKEVNDDILAKNTGIS
jgi:hypothetical protein